MTHLTVRSAVVFIAIALGGTALTGCSETPQEKYDNAVAQLNKARESRSDAQANIDEIEQQIKELRADRNEAQAELDKASAKVGAADQRVNETANDEVLFRTIQREVLNKKAFDKAAISVGVSDRVVTLSGHVADDKTHKRALELARSQPGVKNVVDDLEVRDGSTEAPPESGSGSGAPSGEPAQNPSGSGGSDNTANEAGADSGGDSAPQNSNGGGPNTPKSGES